MSVSHFTYQGMFAVSKYPLWYNESNDKMWHTHWNFRPQHFHKSVYFYHDTSRTPTVMSRQYEYSTASVALRLSNLPLHVRLCLLCTSGSKGKVVALFHLPIHYGYASTSDSLQAFLLRIFIIQKLLNNVLFISVINQLDGQNFCFTISLFHASTCFEHMCSSSGG